MAHRWWKMVPTDTKLFIHIDTYIYIYLYVMWVYVRVLMLTYFFINTRS